MGRVAAFSLAGLLILLVACGSGPKSGDAFTPRQPTDPRTVPTATLPAALPSPILAATNVAGVDAGSSATPASNTYTIKAGDTLGGIAARLGVPLAALESSNAGINPSSLKVGQELRVPSATPTATATANAGRSPTAVPSVAPSATPTSITLATPSAATAGTATATTTPSVGGAQTYTVRAGDTGCTLAARFQVSLQELAEANGTAPSSLARLKVGQQLKIPPPTGSPRGC